MRDYLKNNDWQYPIVSRVGPTAEDMTMDVQDVVTMRDMQLSFEDPVATVRLLAAPTTKIVSLTITEFGYRVPLNEGDYKLIEMALEGSVDADLASENVDPRVRQGDGVWPHARRARGAVQGWRAAVHGHELR